MLVKLLNGTRNEEENNLKTYLLNLKMLWLNQPKRIHPHQLHGGEKLISFRRSSEYCLSHLAF